MVVTSPAGTGADDDAGAEGDDEAQPETATARMGSASAAHMRTCVSKPVSWARGDGLRRMPTLGYSIGAKRVTTTRTTTRPWRRRRRRARDDGGAGRRAGVVAAGDVRVF